VDTPRALAEGTTDRFMNGHEATLRERLVSVGFRWFFNPFRHLAKVRLVSVVIVIQPRSAWSAAQVVGVIREWLRDSGTTIGRQTRYTSGHGSLGGSARFRRPAIPRILASTDAGSPFGR
jgi:hypothetical protein